MIWFTFVDLGTPWPEDAAAQQYVEAATAAPPSINDRIAAAEWQQEGALWVIRVPDVCEYHRHGEKSGDEFFRCDLAFEDGCWFAECFHEDRDDPDGGQKLDVANQDEAKAKAEAIEVLRVYMKDWEETWAANNADHEYEETVRQQEEIWAARRINGDQI